MAYKKYNYGTKKVEIRKLLRKRLLIRAKIRYAKKYEEELEEIDKRIEELLNDNGFIKKNPKRK